jgi:hypothetical protein
MSPTRAVKVLFGLLYIKLRRKNLVKLTTLQKKSNLINEPRQLGYLAKIFALLTIVSGHHLAYRLPT